MAFESPKDYESGRYDWLRDIGEDLANGRIKQISGIFHVHGNHFTACVIDIERAVILYGDGKQEDMPEKTFAFDKLNIALQHDGHSCGILAFNALMHYHDHTVELYNNRDALAMACARVRIAEDLIRLKR
ncbi:hypothetical protein SISSUDRAFT_1056086 [Sistotremastrum suecicum HHB10207 ss-3]|uniref:Ubiquitin-like protease family profile domain-containing protein n=1 Tax=Sistotremastrum suecicum HHB10207 ss-3 TaxID=1314776 RepID=A0A165X9V4_9AGAM|nr:hypothetical protein SISSUDRAFT_1056086 [Sistotremastrum suecicum HHB10207 ss-3]